MRLLGLPPFRPLARAASSPALVRSWMRLPLELGKRPEAGRSEELPPRHPVVRVSGHGVSSIRDFPDECGVGPPRRLFPGLDR